MNVEVFAWELSDMLGISLEVISHKLKIHLKSKPVHHKVRKLNLERQQIF